MRRFVSEATYELESAGFRVVRSNGVVPYQPKPFLIVYKSGGKAVGLPIDRETVCNEALEKAMFDAKLDALRVHVAEVFNEAVDTRVRTPAGPEKAKIRAVSIQLEKALIHIDKALDRMEK